MVVCWADVSEYQRIINNEYPHPVLAIRANDGTYRDRNFAANYTWAQRSIASGKLAALIVYCVYRPNWQATANTLIDMCGSRPPRQMVVMIDVESWGGQITGNQSGNINRLYWTLVEWLGGDERRIIGYGNRGDLDSLWPEKPPKCSLVVASYGSIPFYPNMIAHQYADNVNCPPFGPCDANSADLHTVETLLTALGLRQREREVLHSMDRIPLTLAPADATSDPASWPQINWNYYFDLAGGWEGDCAISIGCQDFPGAFTRKDDSRGYLQIASWIMQDRSLTPITEGPSGDTPYVKGRGKPLPLRGVLGPWVAPRGAVGITMNYSAPGEGCVAVGRSA